MGILTVKYIEALARKVRAGEKVKEWHPDGEHLYLRVLPSGRMSFEYRRRPFKPVLIGAVEVGLPFARSKALETRTKHAQGIDPVVEKADAKKAQSETFESVFTRFIERYAKPELRTWGNIDRGIRKDAMPLWANTPIAEITRKQVGELVDDIVDRGSPRQAALVHSYLHKFFRWAVGRGYVDSNPAEGLPKPKQSPSRKRVLSDDELRLVWHAASSLNWPFEHITKLLMLTGQRKSEISDGSWSEIDLKEKIWRLPASRVKNKSDHEFPLSPKAIAIIKQLPRITPKGSKKPCDLVFSTTGVTSVSGFSRAKRNLDERIAELNDGQTIPEFTWHDFRRTAATGMARLKVPPHIIEACLNHKSGVISGVAGVYNRHEYAEEMREALDAWSKKLEEILK